MLLTDGDEALHLDVGGLDGRRQRLRLGVLEVQRNAAAEDHEVHALRALLFLLITRSRLLRTRRQEGKRRLEAPCRRRHRCWSRTCAHQGHDPSNACRHGRGRCPMHDHRPRNAARAATTGGGRCIACTLVPSIARVSSPDAPWTHSDARLTRRMRMCRCVPLGAPCSAAAASGKADDG